MPSHSMQNVNNSYSASGEATEYGFSDSTLINALTDIQSSTGRTHDRAAIAREASDVFQNQPAADAGEAALAAPFEHYHEFAVPLPPLALNQTTRSVYETLIGHSSPPKVMSHSTLVMKQSGDDVVQNIPMHGIPAPTAIHIDRPLHNQNPGVVKVLKVSMEWVNYLLQHRGFYLPDSYLGNLIAWVITENYPDVPSNIMNQESVSYGQILRAGALETMDHDVASVTKLITQPIDQDDYVTGGADLYRLFDTDIHSDHHKLLWNTATVRNFLNPLSSMGFHVWDKSIARWKHFCQDHRLKRVESHLLQKFHRASKLAIANTTFQVPTFNTSYAVFVSHSAFTSFVPFGFSVMGPITEATHGTAFLEAESMVRECIDEDFLRRSEIKFCIYTRSNEIVEWYRTTAAKPPSYFNIQQDDVAQQNMGDEQQNMDDEQQNVDDSNDFVGQQDLNMSTGSPIDIML